MWQTAWVSSTGSSLHNESMFRNGQRDGNTVLLEQVTMQSHMYRVPHELGNRGLWIACAWTVGSTVPRSLEGKKRIIRMATTIARLVALGLLFCGSIRRVCYTRRRYATWTTCSAGSLQPA